MWIQMSLWRDIDVTVEICGYICHCGETWIQMSLWIWMLLWIWMSLLRDVDMDVIVEMDVTVDIDVTIEICGLRDRCVCFLQP